MLNRDQKLKPQRWQKVRGVMTPAPVIIKSEVFIIEHRVSVAPIKDIFTITTEDIIIIVQLVHGIREVTILLVTKEDQFHLGLARIIPAQTDQDIISLHNTTEDLLTRDFEQEMRFVLEKPPLGLLQLRKIFLHQTRMK